MPSNTEGLSVASPPTLTTNAVFSQSVTMAAQYVRANVTAAIVGVTVGSA
jgi:hypothetical protein